jgi:DNA polymerase-3 subunit epsilon
LTTTLVTDVETTGVPARGEVITSPSYPHLVEAAGLLVDDETERELGSFCFIVRPDGWVISEEVAAVHGISQELAITRGVPLALVVAAYVNLRALADAVAGHNVAFDLGILAAAIHRLGRTPSHPGPDRIVCTADLGASVIKLPPTDKMIAAGYGPYKRPTLLELYRALFDEELRDAHTALADCRAAARCLRELRRRGG